MNNKIVPPAPEETENFLTFITLDMFAFFGSEEG